MPTSEICQSILVSIVVLTGASGVGAFEAPVSHEVGDFPTGVTIGDIDGDGLADVAVANALSGDLSLLFNDGSGLGAEQRIDHGPGDARSVVIEDIDGDGDRDLVVLVRNGDSLIVVLRNQGDGSFGSPEPYGDPGNTFALRLADIDRDGDPDALAASGIVNEAMVTVLRNDGSGSFEVAGSQALAAAQVVYVADIGVADLNGDGYPDVAGSVDTVSAVVVLLNDGEGGLLPAVPMDLGQEFPTGLLARDVDRDGRPDLLVASCSVGLDELRVGLNDGAGGFALSDVVQLNGACHSFTNPTGLTSGYLDDDAVIDLVYASRDTDSVRLLHGLGDGTFEETDVLPTDEDPIVVAAGDVNGDGSHDVVSGNVVTSLPDSIVSTTNESCAPLFDQTVRAAAGIGFSWMTTLPYVAARGVFATADDIGGFAVDSQFSGDANVLQDAESPVAGFGFWYLVRPDCVGASWTSAGAGELAGRDRLLP